MGGNTVFAIKEHFRHCILYEYQLGHDIQTCVENLLKVFPAESISRTTCERWYKRFDGGVFELVDSARTGRPASTSFSQIEALIADNRRASIKDLADLSGMAKSTIHWWFRKKGLAWKFGNWVPHELTTDQKLARISISNALLSRCRSDDFFGRIITGDEKWVAYSNDVRRKQWVLPGSLPENDIRPSLHPQKTMLSVWWCSVGVVHWELLPPNTAINAEYYCGQLERLKDRILEAFSGRLCVLLLHDNARPHTAIATRNKIVDLGWEVLPHPPYSPDLAPTDFHLFLSLQNQLARKKFNNREEIESFINHFFETKNCDFYERGIRSLEERWLWVSNNNGDYFSNN